MQPRRAPMRRGDLGDTKGLNAARPDDLSAALSHGRTRSGAGRRPRFLLSGDIPFCGEAHGTLRAHDAPARTGRLGRRVGREAQLMGRPTGRPFSFRLRHSRFADCLLTLYDPSCPPARKRSVVAELALGTRAAIEDELLLRAVVDPVRLPALLIGG
jgi:hypothetical protein